MNHTILLVDDEPNVFEAISRKLHTEPYRVLTACSAQEAADIMEEEEVDLIVCDEQMPGVLGTELLAKVAEDHPNTIRIVLTGHPSLASALRAINEGRVYQFFTKPCDEINLLVTIRRALEQKDLVSLSRELLEIIMRQSDLLDRARLLRRLLAANPDVRKEIGEHWAAPTEVPHLLDDMVREVRRARAFIDELTTILKS